MSMIQVKIYDTPYGPYVDREPIQIGTGDEIEWTHAEGKDFTVSFGPPPPFAGGPFTPRKPRSGKPVVKGNPNKVYKYSVKTPAGTIDPSVIVY